MRAIIYIKKEKIQRDEKERFAENAVSSPWNRSFYDQRSSDSLFSFLFSTSLRREKKAREFQRLFLEKISKERKREMAPRVYTLWNLWCDGSKNWNERLRARERKVAEKRNLYVKNWELSLKRGNERMLMYDIPFHLCFKIRTDFLWNYHVALWRFTCFSQLLVFLPRGDGLMALFFSINHHILIVQSNNQFCAFILYYYLFWKLEKAFQL